MSEATPPHPRIFISHSVKDNEFGARLVSDLRRTLGDNDAVWYDVSGLQGGDEWWDKILEELTTRDVFIIVLSPDSVVSRWVIRELNTAINEGKRIIPVLYQPCQVRADLKTIQMISFLPPKGYNTAFDELLRALETIEPLSPPMVDTSPVLQDPNGSHVLPDQAFSQTGESTTARQAHTLTEVPPSSAHPEVPKLKTNFSPIRVGLLVGLVFLLIAAGVLFYFVSGGNKANHAPGNTNMTDNAHLTATAAAFQARVNATVTATATLSNPYPFQGTLALNDPLSQPDNWSNDSNSALGGACQFTLGAYHVSQYRTGPLYTCIESSHIFSNSVFEVEMTIIKGGCGGIQVRYDISKNSNYTFGICQNGSYAFRLFIDTIGSHVKMLTSGSSPAIHTGLNHSNVIAVVANGNSFDLYVNYQKIDSVHDATYSHGKIALMADASFNPTEVIFRNAKVWTS